MQGFDGYVVELPDEISRVAADVTLEGYAETSVHDTYAIFFDSDCKATGSNWPGSGAGAFTAGTRYILVSSRLGAGLRFTLKAVEIR